MVWRSNVLGTTGLGPVWAAVPEVGDRLATPYGDGPGPSMALLS